MWCRQREKTLPDGALLLVNGVQFPEGQRRCFSVVQGEVVLLRGSYSSWFDVVILVRTRE